MPVEFKLPELGENVAKGDVVRVLVAVGDVVKKDQGLVELETDKATIEVPTSIAGKVTEIRVKPGDKVKIGQVLVVIDDGAAAAASAPAEAAENKKAPEGAAKAPQAAEKTVADKQEAPSAAPTAAGPVVKSAEESSKVVDIATARSAPKLDAPAAKAVAPVPPPTALAAPVPAAPSVRRFARDLGVDIAQVPGTGPGGRINQDDVQAFVKSHMTSGPSVAGVASQPLPDFTKWGAVDVKPMSGIRRKTAEHLTYAWQTIPHVTQNDKADITSLEAFRKTHGPRVEKAGGKLTVTAILVKIVGMAMDRFPQFASSVDMANESLVFKQYRHVGIAVDTPSGLLVPVLRDVNTKTVTQIAVEIGTLSQKARDKKLTLDEMSGGCITISNLGGIGGTSFTPIVNTPEVAILGVSRGGIEPVWTPSTSLSAGGAFVPREMLPLSLSYDHRVIDGADAIRFVRFVAEALEQPMSMFL